MQQIKVIEEGQSLVLANGLVTARVCLAGGGLDMVYGRGDRRLELRKMHAGAEVDERWIETRARPVIRWEQQEAGGCLPGLESGTELTVVYSAEAGEAQLSLHLGMDGEHPSLWCRLELMNRSDQDLRLGRMRPLRLFRAHGGEALQPRGWAGAKIYLDSNNLCWTGVRALSCVGEGGEGDAVGSNPPNLEALSTGRRGCHHRSGGVGLIYNPTASLAWLTGFVTVEQALGRLVTTYDPAVEEISQWHAECLYDGLAVAPGEGVTSETLYLDFREDPLEALEVYGATVAAVYSLPTRQGTPLLWCSWYAHRLTVTEQKVLDQARIIAQRFLPYGVDLLQVDLGWNWRDTCGEWRAHAERFPHGMEWLARRLTQMGLALGLWVAPSYIGQQSSFFRDHPECLLRDPHTGQPVTFDWEWNTQPRETWQEVYLLDMARTDSQKWLRKIFAEMASWGVSYFKLDFLNGGSESPLLFSRQERNAYRRRDGEQMRLGLRAIREGAGAEAYLLGCNLPISHGLGLLSGIFAAMDVGNATGNYSHLKSRMTTLVSRWYQQKRFWHNDPDVLYLGGEFLDPSDECEEGEARIRATAVALSGGPVLLGDDLTTLSEERLEMYTLCLPAYGTAARPVDLFESDHPRIWDLEVEADWGRWHVVGLFNYDEAEVDMGVCFADLGLDEEKEYVVWEFWDLELLGCHRGGVEVPVRGRSARTLAIRPVVDHPQVLSTSFHLTQGGVEISEVLWEARGMILSGVCHRAPGAAGRVYLSSPEGYGATGVEFDEGATGVLEVGDAVVAVGLRMERETARWRVRF